MTTIPGFIDTTGFVSRASIYSKSFETDGAIWLPAGSGSLFTPYVGAWTATRNALGDYSLNLTAAANSPIIAVNINEVFEKIGADPITAAIVTNFPSGTSNFPAPITLGSETLATDSDVHLIRGFKLVSYDVVYTLGTASLTTHTGTIVTSKWATGAAAGAATTTKDGPAALGTTTSANNIITNRPLTTPYVLGLNVSVAGGPDQADWLEINITNPGTSVYKLYGVRLYVNYCIL